MPLPRTRTFGMQDVALTARIALATTPETNRLVSPIAGYVERIIAVRGAGQTPGEQWTVTIGNNAAKVFTGTLGGAARDTDVFEFADGESNGIDAGGLITIASAGLPGLPAPAAVCVVIRGQ